MGHYGSLDKRNHWLYRIGLAMFSFSALLVVVNLMDEPQFWLNPEWLSYAASCLISTCLLLGYDKLRFRGFTTYCIAATFFFAAALVPAQSPTLHAYVLALMVSGALASLYFGEKMDRDTLEKTTGVRKFW